MTRSEPGVLAFREGRVAHATEDRPWFDVPLAEVTRVRFPWYYFGGGVKLRVAGERLRLSFVRPNDADDVSDRLLARGPWGGVAAVSVSVRKIADVGTGRRAGAVWKRILHAGSP